MPPPDSSTSSRVRASNDPPRRLPVGADLGETSGVHFRVWAPRARTLHVALEGGPGTGSAHQLQACGEGYFAGHVAAAAAGTRYRYSLDGGKPLPDPASRFQPEGPHGPSEVVDPSFGWTDEAWPGPSLPGAVVYELHVGTFTRDGTWRAAAEHLPWLAELGVTIIEVMPVADFPGRFGWGYDGVNLFAPTRLYGTPGDFRTFVDRAHRVGIGVILDVVYNHLGPDGNYLTQYSDTYFSRRHRTEWGDAFNFDDAGSEPVRELITANVRYWASEYHLDGLRLDATQSMFDDSPRHILADIREAFTTGADDRATVVIGENEPQNVRLLRPAAEGGSGIDALWNDDFHHAARVALTGKAEAYYTDYQGSAQELVSAAKHSYLYQGQWYRWQQQRRGTSTRGVAPRHFVHYLDNHDQVANSAMGERVHQITSPARLRAMTGLLLLGPQTPMLFQGQEFSASAPFLYFADHSGELGKRVREGRGEFLAQFPSIAQPAVRGALPDPADPATFERCRLDHRERDEHVEAVALHRDLLRIRREDPVIRGQAAEGLDGAVLAPDAFVLRWFSAQGDEDRILIVNLGRAVRPATASEPLLAPPAGTTWRICWTSDDPRYGGPGTAPPERDRRMQGEPTTGGGARTPLKAHPVWHFPGECAVLLEPERTS